MGTIQTKSIQSTTMIMIGFAIGAYNMLVLSPKILSTEQLGLTRIIADAGLTLAMLCTLGSIPVIYKFFPFYKSYLKKESIDLPYVTGMLCLAGTIIMIFIGWLCKDIIVRKFSEKSPLFVEYSYLVYPYSLLMLCFMWMESFAISLHKGVYSNTFREILPRLIFTIILLLFSFSILSERQLYVLFSFSYLIPVILLYILLKKTGHFRIVPKISSLTTRLGGKMASFGLFVFGAQFLNLLSKTVDTFIISAKSNNGLADTAIFTIATYIVTLMEVPQRSMNSVTIPVLAESWKNKDLDHIGRIYKKSVTNLLVVGLAMFSLLWLNLNNIALFLGKNFNGIEIVILFMGIAKLIDLGTGANSQIIGTSSYWKVDFTTNVIYTIVALPLNYFLISKFGLLGAAYSTLISVTFYNAMRFGFLWYKFGMQPYTKNDLIVVLISVISILIVSRIPIISNLYLDCTIRLLAFITLFTPTIYLLKISPQINEWLEKIFKQMVKR